MLVEFVSHVDVGRLDGGEDQLSNTCTHGVKHLFFTVRTRGNIPLNSAQVKQAFLLTVNGTEA